MEGRMSLKYFCYAEFLVFYPLLYKFLLLFVLFCLFFVFFNWTISSTTVKSVFFWQTLICCSCFCKDQMGNGSCTATFCMLLEIVKCRPYNRPFFSSCKAVVWIQWIHSVSPTLAGSTLEKRVVLVKWLSSKMFQRDRLMTHSLFWFARSFSGYVKFQPELRDLQLSIIFSLFPDYPLNQHRLCSLHQPSEMGEYSYFCCRGRWKFGLSDSVH